MMSQHEYDAMVSALATLQTLSQFLPRVVGSCERGDRLEAVAMTQALIRMVDQEMATHPIFSSM